MKKIVKCVYFAKNELVKLVNEGCTIENISNKTEFTSKEIYELLKENLEEKEYIKLIKKIGQNEALTYKVKEENVIVVDTSFLLGKSLEELEIFFNNDRWPICIPSVVMGELSPPSKEHLTSRDNNSKEIKKLIMKNKKVAHIRYVKYNENLHMRYKEQLDPTWIMNNDLRILLSTLAMKEDYKKVFILSNDIDQRSKAAYLGIDAFNYSCLKV